MSRSTKSTVIAAGVILTAFLGSLTGLIAQAPGGQAPPPPPANTPPKPLVPVAASSIAANPDTYMNEYVTVTAAVEANLSKTAFSVDQDKTKNTGKEVLVLAPTLQSATDVNTYVTVIGQLVKFDPADVATKLKDYKLDLSPDAVSKYMGKPVVLATAVINTAGIDIAKKPIPSADHRRFGAPARDDAAAPGPGGAAQGDRRLLGRSHEGAGDDHAERVRRNRNVLEDQGQHRRDEHRRRRQEARRRDSHRVGHRAMGSGEGGRHTHGRGVRHLPRQVSRAHGRRDVQDQNWRLVTDN